MNLLAPLLLAALAQAPPADPQPPPEFSGVVVDPSGQPVGGARVWLAGTPWYTGIALRGEATTDAEGRFRMPRTARADGDGEPESFTLWAHAAGHRIGVRSIVGDLPGPGEPARVEVGPPARTVIRLIPPDPGRPIGGKVEVFEVHREPQRMPRAMIQALGVPIGADGVATLDGYLPEDIAGLDARTEAYGTQTRRWYPPVPGDRTIRLRPVGSVAVKLVPASDGAGPATLKGWKISAITYPNDEPGYTGAVGYYWEDTDEQGRVRFPVLPTGRLLITARAPEGVAAIAEDVEAGVLKPGATVEVDAPARRAVIVEGFVRESGTGKPIPGVPINLFISGRNGPWNHGVRTDAQGHYAQVMIPGEVSMFSPSATGYYPARKTDGVEKQVVPEGVERFTWPVIEMARGAEVRGIVLDAQNRPVAGATILRSPPAGAGRDQPAARTNDRGEFRVGGLVPGQEVRLYAKKGGDATPEPAVARAGADALTVLAVAPSDAVSLRGRVLGSDGRPVPNALIRIQSRATQGQNSFGVSSVGWDGADFVRTGPDGTFETPRELQPGPTYSAEAVAEGMAKGQTEWIVASKGQFPDLTLRRLRGLRAVSGRVVDRAGAPVAGVEVSQSGDGPAPTRSVTDDAGRFRVEGVLDDRAFLFARKDRFRTRYRAIGPGTAEVEILLARVDEQPDPAPSATPPAMTRAEEKNLARKLVAAERARIVADRDNGTLRFHLLELDARLEPDRTIEQVENQVVQAGSVLSNLAIGMSEDDPRGALELVESDRDDTLAATAYLALHDALPRSEAGRRRDLLDRAERRARTMTDTRNGYGEGRPSMLAKVADRRLNLGDRDRALMILGEARPWFETLPKPNESFWGDDTLRAFARTDLPAALAFLDRDEPTRKTNSGVYDRNAEAAALGAAESDPAEAERLLGRIQQDYTRREATRRACLVMAGRDLDRARRLAADLKDRPNANPTFPPLLTAIAAREAADADPRAARARLDEAFAEYEKLAELQRNGRYYGDLLAMMAMLLPVAERIDPALVPEYLARTLAARPPRGEAADPDSAGPAALFAMFVARYDAEAAAVAFGRAAEDLLSPSPWPSGPNQQQINAVVLPASTFDPRLAMAIVDRIPDDPAASPTTPWFDAHRKALVRLELARALSRPIPARRAEVTRTLHHEWPIQRLD